MRRRLQAEFDVANCNIKIANPPRSVRLRLRPMDSAPGEAWLGSPYLPPDGTRASLKPRTLPRFAGPFPRQSAARLNLP